MSSDSWQYNMLRDEIAERAGWRAKARPLAFRRAYEIALEEFQATGFALTPEKLTQRVERRYRRKYPRDFDLGPAIVRNVYGFPWLVLALGLIRLVVSILIAIYTESPGKKDLIQSAAAHLAEH